MDNTDHFCVPIHPHERLDDLHRNGYSIIQDPKRFCFGQDAVLLAAFAKAHAGELALDLCAGTGIVSILMAARTQAQKLYGLEIQPESVDMARRSVALNGLSHQIQIDSGDIKEAAALYALSSFDVITANPPYMNHGGGLTNSYSPKAIARHEILCNLGDVTEAAAKLLKPQGRFYMVHRPGRLPDILESLRQNHLEPKAMRLVHSYIHKEPSMVLIEAIRNGKPLLKVLPPLIICQEDGQYTEEAYEIYYR